MQLTASQLQTLNTDIEANFPSVPKNSDGADQVAKAYNLAASPVFVVWKTFIDNHQVRGATVWTELIARSQGERDVYQILIANGGVNPSELNVRQAFQDIFSGGQGATTRAQLVAISKRNATRIERLFATGTGTDASPGTMAANVSGPIEYTEVLKAMELP